MSTQELSTVSPKFMRDQAGGACWFNTDVMEGLLQVRILLLAAFWLIVLSNSSAALSSVQSPSPDVEEVVVRGYPPHCRARQGDVLDQLDPVAAAMATGQQIVEPDPAGGPPTLKPDYYPTTGPQTWQRDGEHLENYIFRVPLDGMPLCIGARRKYAPGFAQLRRAIDAHPYHGQVVRFTAFVATRNAQNVLFWLAAGTNSRPIHYNIVAGDDSRRRPIVGNHGWTPISFSIGPIPCSADQISYGVTLEGGGDVWIYKPDFGRAPDEEIPKGLKRDRKFIDSDSYCRKLHYGAGADQPPK